MNSLIFTHMTKLNLSGMQVGELVNLRVSAIDSNRMMIRICQGKGHIGKNREPAGPHLVMKPTLEVGDIFRKYGVEYRQSHAMSLPQLKAMSAISHCRTGALGGHKDQCDHCGHIHISYNSCRNRHCPKCQSLAKERWLEARKAELLPVPYFHVVCTLPEELNPMVRGNEQVCFDLREIPCRAEGCLAAGEIGLSRAVGGM